LTTSHFLNAFTKGKRVLLIVLSSFFPSFFSDCFFPFPSPLWFGQFRKWNPLSRQTEYCFRILMNSQFLYTVESDYNAFPTIGTIVWVAPGTLFFFLNKRFLFNLDSPWALSILNSASFLSETTLKDEETRAFLGLATKTC